MPATTVYLTVLIVGLVIFFVAGILRSLLYFDNFIEDGQQNIYATSVLLMNIGIMVSAIGFAMGGFKARELHEKVRSSMLSAVGMCILAGVLVNVFLFFD